MKSLKELYRVGHGPSSSHTMGPRRAAETFRGRYPNATAWRVTLYSSLAATGKGHLTDVALHEALAPEPLEIVWKLEEELGYHPNGMCFEALAQGGDVLGKWEVFSTGGGALAEADGELQEESVVYDLKDMESILEHCKRSGQSLWEYVEECEGAEIQEFLLDIWRRMQDSIRVGIETEGALPGPLGLARKAWTFHRKAGYSPISC